MKFRVYDKQSGEYITGEERKYAGLNMNGEFCYIDNNAELHPYDQDRYTVEQFTGFCDKNGREIYEGDRVERKHEFGVVQFVNGQWVIMRGGILLGSVAYQAADFEVTGTVHDANCSEKSNS